MSSNNPLIKKSKDDLSSPEIGRANERLHVPAIVFPSSLKSDEFSTRSDNISIPPQSEETTEIIFSNHNNDVRKTVDIVHSLPPPPASTYTTSADPDLDTEGTQFSIASSTKTIGADGSSLKSTSLVSPPITDSSIGEESDVVPLLKSDNIIRSGNNTEMNYSQTLGSETNDTMVDQGSAAPERIDLATGEPIEADPSLDSPKFIAEDKTGHISDLPKVLRLDHKRMTARQKDMMRTFVTVFVNFYMPMSVYKETPLLQYDPALIDLVFETITDDKHPALDKVFTLLVILSRNVKSKAPNGGVEPRIKTIFDIIRAQGTSREVIQEAIRSLINYAEANAEIIEQCGGLDALMLQFTSHMQDKAFLTPLLWTLRNVTVTERCRKTILDRQGFLIVNTISANLGDADVVENACYTLGNLALADDFGGLFMAIGAISAIKSGLTTNMEKERVVEAALWAINNAAFDPMILKSYLKAGIEEQMINSLRKHISNRRIVEYAETVIKRIRAMVHANSPQAIAERNANKVIRSGEIYIESGLLKRWKKKNFILQPSRLTYSDEDLDGEVDGEIKLRDIVDINRDPSHATIICLHTKTKALRLDLKRLSKEVNDAWFSDLKSAWKSAVSAVLEFPVSPAEQRPGAGGAGFPGFHFMNNNTTENVLDRDFDKVATASVLHEIYCHPNFLTKDFKPMEKQYPEVQVWDFIATKMAKKFAQIMVARKQEFKLADKEAFDLEKIKKEAEHLVEETLMKEIAAIENDAEFFKNPPKVITRYEYCAKQGIRPTMEDRHIHLPYIDLLVNREGKEDTVSYYAVYDGHGGINVAAWVEIHLHQNIMRHPDFETDTKKAIIESFTKTQDELKEHFERLFLPGTAGSTAVTVLFKGNKMYVSWAGDSLASMFGKKQDIELVDPHKPTKPSEKARIEKMGGFVNEEQGVMRVNGAVAVSRAFGNIRHRVITPDADVVIHELSGDEEYVVVACDGLWDVMTTEQVRKFVRNYMKKHGKRTKGISEALVNEALKLGSTDNVSVVFVEFEWWKEPKRN